MSSTAAPLLELCRVSKAFLVDGRRTEALQDISLRAEPQEFITLIGPSGCGKSTLLNIICGLLEADTGEVRLHGRAEPAGARIGRVGYMPQRDLLLPWRKLLDNILLGPEILHRDLEEARREARELLPLFGLAGFEDYYPATLSGGMRQRAALMRTFLCKQDLILLDEPFGALDALTRRIMCRWLLDVWARFRQTMIFVTHDVDEAIYLADRVYVFSPRPGRILCEFEIALPRPREEHLLAEPRFAAYREEILRCLGVEG
jgi:ABC-type nitrate/sulfonate/bicarbonate transport system ATPase subunit